MLRPITTIGAVAALSLLFASPAWAPRDCPSCGLTKQGGKKVSNPADKSFGGPDTKSLGGPDTKTVGNPNEKTFAQKGPAPHLRKGKGNPAGIAPPDPDMPGWARALFGNDAQMGGGGGGGGGGGR